MSRKQDVVSEVTTYLRRVGGRRTSKVVTADDVQNYLDNKSFRGSRDERLSVIRSVLQEPQFTPSGYTRSTREAARGRMIREWRVSR